MEKKNKITQNEPVHHQIRKKKKEKKKQKKKEWDKKEFIDFLTNDRLEGLHNIPTFLNINVKFFRFFTWQFWFLCPLWPFWKDFSIFKLIF